MNNAAIAPSVAGLRMALVSPAVTGLGGSEEALAATASILADAGARVQLIGASADNNMAAALSDSLRPWRRSETQAVRALADELAASSDIVDFQRVAPLALVNALRGRVPCALTVHTVEHTCPAGSRYLRKSGASCTRAPGVGCLDQDRREICLCFADGRRFGWRDRLYALAQLRRNRALAAALDFAIYNSNATRACFEQFVGKPRAAVIAPPLVSALASSSRDAKRIVFVGRVEAFKGVFDLPEILAGLEGTTLEILGAGSALEELRARFAARGLLPRVDFRGWASRTEVEASLARASCALAPSYGFEAWGMIGPEAIAQGCPVVAYGSGGMGEWCLPQFGTLVPMGNAKAMAQAAQSWLKRRAGGLDTSSWPAEAERRWGKARWLREYGEALGEARAAFKSKA